MARCILLAWSLALTGLVDADNLPEWPQFRGPGGSAVSDTAVPPAFLSPSSNLNWRVAIPRGDSSPIVAGNRIFLTAENDGRLETLALARENGSVLWRHPASSERFAPNPNPSAPGRATSTPVTDGIMVYSFFGSVGAIAYDLEGKERWRHSLENPDGEISASPILIGSNLILVCDVGAGSFIEALDKKTGRPVWRREREQVHRSYSTPFHWVHEKRDEVVVAGSFWLTSYDPRTGEQNWRYSGTAPAAGSSPAAAPTLLFSASSRIGNESGEGAATAPETLGLLADLDPVSSPVTPVPEKALVAIRACARGEVNRTDLAWKKTRSLPDPSSPVFYNHRLFTIKAGGLVSAFRVPDGEPIYQDERLGTAGNYYASAVAAQGRIYFISQYGVVTVIDANADTLRVLAQSRLGEQTLATPALVGMEILVRTEKALYSFGAPR